MTADAMLLSFGRETVLNCLKDAAMIDITGRKL